jgi:hypothetical protein
VKSTPQAAAHRRIMQRKGGYDRPTHDAFRAAHERARRIREDRLDRIAELRAYILDQRGHAS